MTAQQVVQICIYAETQLIVSNDSLLHTQSLQRLAINNFDVSFNGYSRRVNLFLLSIYLIHTLFDKINISRRVFFSFNCTYWIRIKVRIKTIPIHYLV